MTLEDQTPVFHPKGHYYRKIEASYPGGSCELLTTMPPPSLTMAESFGTISGLGALFCLVLGVINVYTETITEAYTYFVLFN